MNFNKPIVTATFIRRPNRFQGYVELAGEEILVHVPNTGRLKEILLPGVTVYLRKEEGPKRKTGYSLIAALKGDKLINFDSQIPNKVVAEALNARRIPKLDQYQIVEAEKTFGASRFDFRLSDDYRGIYYLEVKGVTLEFDGVVAFPDAVTLRGSKHLRELISVKKAGHGAGVLFLVQMSEAQYFRPYWERDPDFALALKEALLAGVDVFCYTCETTPTSLTLKDPIPIMV